MSVSRQFAPPLQANPRPSPRVTKSERTRAAILNAALDFLWSRPFREMTVHSLMASTGVSRPAFYQYFRDLREVMETLLGLLQDDIFTAAEPWIAGVGDPVALMHDSLASLVRVSYRRGPFLRAIADAAATDRLLEKAWVQFLGGFDDAACARIEADQRQGLSPEFEARPVAVALNRLNAATLIEMFGRRPRSRPEPIREALDRIWISSLYGPRWIGKGSSNLVRS